jgi:hypothetical protein
MVAATKLGIQQRYLRAMHRLSFVFVLTHAVALACAQDAEHPFIQSFNLTVLEGRIHVEWVMSGGSTCDGSSVERSADGIGFEEVHRINGLCGDPEFPAPFDWFDEAPPELSTVRYRIAFSGQGRSSVKSVEFRQLTGSEQRVFPVPATSAATLLLRVSLSALVDLAVMDPAGRVVLREERAGRENAIDMGDWPAGIYTYLAVADGRRFAGRLVKQ